MKNYLRETSFFDFSHPGIQELISPFKDLPESEKIAGIFTRIRDGWRYNPFVIYQQPKNYTASFVASQKEGHCIDKSTLFIAAARGMGIPARIRLARVMNHIAVERLMAKLGTEYIAPHGIAEIYVQGEWKKASTAFNKGLCALYKVEPLEFDGTDDAILQAFNNDQLQFMEYVEDYGAFDDLPLEFILRVFKENYPEVSKQMIGKNKIEL